MLVAPAGGAWCESTDRWVEVRSPDDPRGGPEVLTSQRRDDRWQAEVAGRWAAELSTASYIPMSRQAVEDALRELVEEVVRALDGASELDEVGRSVGDRLVRIHATGEESLGISLRVLRDALVAEPGGGQVRPLVQLLTGIAAGYAAADRESTFIQQETLKRALLRSKLKADRDLAASEARFGEVFSSTPIGVAICELGGEFVQVNPAWEDTLGYRSADLESMTIHDLFHPDDAEYVAAAYAEIAETGRSGRLDERVRLVRASGEEAWAYLALSVLRGPDGSARRLVTMVEDITELHLLQQQFQYQALHDALTGLPNRQFFRTRLETALCNLPPNARLGLYHLGLDGFQLINDGLGHAVGDHVIRLAARRLEGLVDNEEALVARFGGTEFAVLMWEREGTPGVGEFVAMVNDALSKPIYVGDQGIATSASIGVVQRLAGEGDATEMLWAADVALRRAEAVGKRQWALFDPDRAPEERLEAKRAAVMPGGLATGEFDVAYRSAMDLRDGRTYGVEAQLLWETEEFGTIRHHECLRLAERSGVTLSLRDWMLRTVCEHRAEWWRDGHPTAVAVRLSANQAQDPDLVAVVRRALADDPGEGGELRLCIPTSAVLGPHEEARENVHHLDALGVRTALHGFTGAAEELHQLRTLPVDVVQLDHGMVELVHDALAEGPAALDAPEVDAVRGIVPLITRCGADICVGEIDTDVQARFWRDLGCRIGLGAAYGDAVLSFDVPDLLSKIS